MRTAAIILGAVVTVALGAALRHYHPYVIGLGVAVLGGLAYLVGYVDGSSGR